MRVKGERKKIWEERWITPDNIECPDRITRHSEVALASFVEIADDLPVTGHRLSRTVRGTDAPRSMVEVFAVARFCAMELITILNRCHRFRGFVYHRARFTSDHKSIEISVRPRKRSAAICSRCHQYAPGYDQLPKRRFEFIPLWGFFVFRLYAMRRVAELILNYFRAQKLLSSGVVEGLNNKAKVTMRKSYGFRTYRVLELALYHSLWQAARAGVHPRFLLTVKKYNRQ